MSTTGFCICRSIFGVKNTLLSFSVLHHTTMCLRLLICSWEGPWAFLAVPLGSLDFQLDSLALHKPWAPVASSQLWMGEEGFLLCSAGDSGHLGQGPDAGVPERSWRLVAGLTSLLHFHPVLSCCLKCVWRTELKNEHANPKFPERAILQPPVHSRRVVGSLGPPLPTA